MTTHSHSLYWAHALTLQSASDSIDNLSRSIANAKVDLNPHQVDAALFEFRSPLSKGAILADEVGLGKTIEAGIVIAQRWAERRRKILLINVNLETLYSFMVSGFKIRGHVQPFESRSATCSDG